MHVYLPRKKIQRLHEILFRFKGRITACQANKRKRKNLKLKIGAKAKRRPKQKSGV